MTARLARRRRRGLPQPPNEVTRLRLLVAPRGRRTGWRAAAVRILRLA